MQRAKIQDLSEGSDHFLPEAIDFAQTAAKFSPMPQRHDAGACRKRSVIRSAVDQNFFERSLNRSKFVRAALWPLLDPQFQVLR